MMQDCMVNGSLGSSFGAKGKEINALKPSASPGKLLDSNDLMEQYVATMDKKLQKAVADLEAAREEAAAAQKRSEEQAKELADLKEAWDKERKELTTSRDDLASQLTQLQMRQAKKATDEFEAHWENLRQDSGAGAALEKAEKHIKSLQEQNANLCYRLSEMRQDLAKAEAAAAK